MTIELPNDLFEAVSEAAKKKGTSPDTLAASYLRDELTRRGFLTKPLDPQERKPATLAERLAPYIGILDGPADLSENISQKFGELLEEDHRRHSRDPN